MPGEQLLLINPRRRRKRHRNSRRRRHHAGGYRIRRRRIRNPRSRHRRRHRNPRRHHYRRHRYRNPISMSGMTAALVPAAYGAAGAVALDFAFNFLSPYIPSQVSSIPYGPQLLRIAGAFGLGMLGKKFLGGEKGNAVMAGALTVTLYNIAATTLGGTAGMAGLGAYMNRFSGLGGPTMNPAVYINRPMGRLGRVGRVGRVGAYMSPRVSTMSGLPFAGLKGPEGMSQDMFEQDMFE